MLRCYFDTEATHRPLLDEHHTSPGQPHLTRIAAILMDGTIEVMAFHATIQPDGWEPTITEYYPPEGYAHAVPLVGALTVFAGFMRLGGSVAAWGLASHLMVMRAAHSRAVKIMPEVPSIQACIATISKQAGNFPRFPTMSQASEKFFMSPIPLLHPLEDARMCGMIDRHISAGGAGAVDAARAMAALGDRVAA